jgi:uncharacterized protein CbrC (UPF0167 family)
MTFKYFDKPEILIGIQDKKEICDTCGEEKYCFNAEAFYGEESINSICPNCLAIGKLLGRSIYTCTGDVLELKRQIKELNPAMSDDEVDILSKEKTEELEKKTPHLTTWQDWSWPSADGDYCKFIGYGSKPFYKELARSNRIEEFFKDSFYDKNSFTDNLWEDVPDKLIRNFEESNQYNILFYIFKSLNSDKIITIWDCN